MHSSGAGHVSPVDASGPGPSCDFPIIRTHGNLDTAVCAAFAFRAEAYPIRERYVSDRRRTDIPLIARDKTGGVRFYDENSQQLR
ncbi:MAG: hypothetical protein OXN84_18775, partial [Albidovulum sp.]|nr:hypothetical protein [Albidovulum sp.]